MSTLTFTGVQVNYYFICKRKLWYFSHNIEMEHTSDLVAMGSLIHDYSYKRSKKEICIDNRIQIDFLGSRPVIHEVKKSNRMEDADKWQIKYYLYYLKKMKGVNDLTAEIHYPKLKKVEMLELNRDDEIEMDKILAGIKDIMDLDMPPEIEYKGRCKKCSYYELCMVD